MESDDRAPHERVSTDVVGRVNLKKGLGAGVADSVENASPPLAVSVLLLVFTTMIMVGALILILHNVFRVIPG